MRLVKDFVLQEDDGMELVVPAGTKLWRVPDQDCDARLALDGFVELMYHDGKGLSEFVLDRGEYAEYVRECD